MRPTEEEFAYKRKHQWDESSEEEEGKRIAVHAGNAHDAL
jgi:hypothetical protein